MERDSYPPASENQNDGMTPKQRQQFKEFMEGTDAIPFATDANGDRVQADQPMPEDEFDRRRREAEEQ